MRMQFASWQSVLFAHASALVMLSGAPHSAGANRSGPGPEQSPTHDGPRGQINDAGFWEWIGSTRRSPQIQYINPEVPAIESPAYPGTRYEAVVPDTLDLAERATLAVHALTALTDADADYEIYFAAQPQTDPPLMFHSFDDWVQPKWHEALPLARLAGGSHLNKQVDQRWMEIVMQMQGPDGVLYQPLIGRPWARTGCCGISAADVQGDHYTAPYYSGRMLSAMALYYRLTGDERWRNVGQRVVNGLIRQAVDKGDYAYFPQHLYGVNEVPAPEAPLPGLWGGQGAQAWIGLGLAQFYQVTGYEPALLLLGKLARCIRYQSGLFDADGRWEGQHFHFTLHHLLALLGYAQAAHDAEMISFANAGYQCARAKATMNPMVGYVSETDDPDRFSETCGVADMIDLALKLTKAGAGDYWDDVDRWTRNQFAGNQLLSSGWVYEMAQEQPRPALDPSLKDLLATNSASPTVNTDQVPERCLGAFASYPSAHQWIGPLGFNVNAHSACCTGNGARAIYYVWNNIVHSEDGQLRVNLLLNRASPWADVDSFIPYEGRGDVKIKQACELSVRIPEWVQPNETRCQVNGTDRLLSWDGRYAVVGQVEPNDVATLSFPIFERTDQVQIKGRGYTLIRKGNTVVHIDPPGEYGPLYQREKYRENKAPSKKVERFVALQQIEW